MKFAMVTASALTAAMSGSCQTVANDAPEWAVRIALEDPAFGGGAFFSSRLLGNPMNEAIGDLGARIQFLHRQRAVHDERARLLASESMSGATARAALAFLSSDSGAALVSAELLATTSYPQHGDAFPGQAADYFGDPARVGCAALLEFERAREAWLRGETPSPRLLSMVIGALRVSPSQATAIAEFYRSEAGAEWLRARARAFASTQQRYRAFRSAAAQLGLIRSKMDWEELILPWAEFPEDDPDKR